MKEAYLIIKTGFEGIEKLCYLTKNKEEAIRNFKRIKEEEIKEIEKDRKVMNEYWRKEKKLEMIKEEKLTQEEIQKIEDFFCIQKWDGKEFSCACEELGVPPSEPKWR